MKTEGAQKSSALQPTSAKYPKPCPMLIQFIISHDKKDHDGKTNARMWHLKTK